MESLEEGVFWSAGKLTRGGKKPVLEAERGGTEEEEGEISTSRMGGSPQQPPLNDVDPQPEVVWLLNEEALEDINSYVESRKDPDNIAAEASVILEIQQQLGLNYGNSETDPTNKLVEMEIRD
jgi:hypothetical protein